MKERKEGGINYRKYYGVVLLIRNIALTIYIVNSFFQRPLWCIRKGYTVNSIIIK